MSSTPLRDAEAAIASGDVAKAIAIARSALDKGLEHPLFLNLRAFWLEGQGRDAQALADLERAKALAPKDASICNALGLAYARNNRHREAIVCFNDAIAIAPGFGPAYFNKAWTSEELGDLSAARQAYLRAHELTPEVPEPLAGLAAIATRMSDWTQARRFAARALALQPDHAIAMRALAAAEISSGEAAAGENRLRALLARSDLPPTERSLTESLLADLLDAQGRSADAFAAYRSSNETLRAYYAPKYRAPGAETTPEYLHWITQYFEKANPAEWSSSTDGFSDMTDTPRGHIFMVGFPRSGTTLLEQVLGSSSLTVTSGERDTLDDATREFMGSPAALDRLASMQGAGLRRQRRAYWQRVREYGLSVEGRIFIDKQPYNTLKLPLIAKLFPGARIIFSLRDPRDVVLSCFRRKFRMSAPNYELLTLEGAASLYASTMQLADIYRTKLSLAVRDVRHEDLVADFETHVKDVCAFLNLPWDTSMRDFASQRRGITTPSATQVARGLNSEGIGTWRRYAAQMAPGLPILAPWIERFGYAKE